MKKFLIYCIKDEFAEHYYYKSDVLFRFLKSHREKRTRKDFNLQFDYITKDFPDNLIYQLISQLRHVNSMQFFKHDNHLKLYGDYYDLSLYIYEKQLTIHCQSLYEAEAILFPALRLFHPYLFIIDNHFEEFGWLSPDKNKFTLTEKKQLLYSFL